jgi:hypothetical protein
MYDFLQPATWPASVLHSPTLTLAAIEFSRKNARFFAGYAVDAYQVPFAWTPPARVFVEVRIERAALLDHERGEVLGRWKMRRSPVPSLKTFQGSKDAAEPLAALPPEVASNVTEPGPATLAVDGQHGPVVLPVRWAVDRGGIFAAAPASFLELAGVRDHTAVALTVDRASTWRASAMVGVLMRGRAEIHDPRTLESGVSAAADAITATGADPDRDVLLQVRPSRLVWWRGWQSDTVAAG